MILDASGQPLSRSGLEELERMIVAEGLRRLAPRRRDRALDLVDPSGRPLIERTGIGDTVRLRIPERFRSEAQ